MFRSSLRSLTILAALGAYTAPVDAQVPTDTWVATSFDDFIGGTGGGGIFLVSADRNDLIPITNPTPNMAAANAAIADNSGIIYYGTFQSSSVPVPNPGEIFQLILTISGTPPQATVLSEVSLTTGGSIGSVNGLTLRGDEIWYVAGRNVGFIPRTGGMHTHVVTPTTNGSPQSITTNGREIFFGTAYSSSSPDPFTVWSFDPNSATPTETGVALISSPSSANSAFDMNLGRDGHVFVGTFGGWLFDVDPFTGTATQLNSGSAPPGNANGASLNPWSNIAGDVPGYGSTPRQFDFFDVTAATWFAGVHTITGVPSNVTSAHELPFELFGEGCPGANGMEPRMGWTGMPMQGQTFDLTLRDADVGLGLLVLGLSDTNSTLGPLPVNLSQVFGFIPQGCQLFVSIGAVNAVLVPASGSASLTVSIPANPALLGFQAYGQWGVLGSGAQVSVSDAVHIQVR